MGIEEIVKLASNKAAAQKKEMELYITADCPGGTGMYYRILKLIKAGTIQLSPYLNIVSIKVAAEFNQQSVADSQGGHLTQVMYSPCAHKEIVPVRHIALS